MWLNRLGIACAVVIMVAGCESSSSSKRGASHDSTVRGPSDEKLTIMKPKDQDIARGETETVTVYLHREHFDGPVSLKVTNLPRGVEAVDAPRQTSDNNAKIVLRATANADLVSNHNVMVTAEGPGGMRASETFNLTVKERG